MARVFHFLPDEARPLARWLDFRGVTEAALMGWLSRHWAEALPTLLDDHRATQWEHLGYWVESERLVQMLNEQLLLPLGDPTDRPASNLAEAVRRVEHLVGHPGFDACWQSVMKQGLALRLAYIERAGFGRQVQEFIALSHGLGQLVKALDALSEQADVPAANLERVLQEAAIVEHMARALYATDWVRAEGEAGLTVAGDVMEQMPAVPPAAYAAAYRLADQIESLNGAPLQDLLKMAAQADGYEAAPDQHYCELFGHYLAMEAMGDGVSWFDDHADFPLALPSIEYFDGFMSSDYGMPRAVGEGRALAAGPRRAFSVPSRP